MRNFAKSFIERAYLDISGKITSMSMRIFWSVKYLLSIFLRILFKVSAFLSLSVCLLIACNIPVYATPPELAYISTVTCVYFSGVAYISALVEAPWVVEEVLVTACNDWGCL
jgi:hypothetical protein